MHDTAPRIAPLEAPFEPDIEQALARMMPKNGKVPPLALFRTLAKDRQLYEAMGVLGRFQLRHDPEKDSAIAPRDREVVIHRVCARCGCEYEWGVHVASYAAKVGFTAEQVAATVQGDSAAGVWSERDRLLIRFVDALHDTAQVPDDLWNDMAKHWSERQLLQLLVLAGWYHAISYLANAARTPLETWAARFPAPAAR